METFVVNAPATVALEQVHRIQEGHPETIIPHLDCRMRRETVLTPVKPSNGVTQTGAIFHSKRRVQPDRSEHSVQHSPDDIGGRKYSGD